RDLRLHASALGARRHPLFSRHRPAHHQPDVSQMVDRVMSLPEGTRFYLLSPMVRGRKGEYRKELAELMKRGFQRVKIDGQMHLIEEAPSLDKKIKHDIDVVVDRLAVRDGIQQRLAEGLETALRLSDDIAVVEMAEVKEGETPERILFSAK